MLGKLVRTRLTQHDINPHRSERTFLQLSRTAIRTAELDWKLYQWHHPQTTFNTFSPSFSSILLVAGYLSRRARKDMGWRYCDLHELEQVFYRDFPGLERRHYPGKNRQSLEKVDHDYKLLYRQLFCSLLTSGSSPYSLSTRRGPFLR